jgi:SAM-dependent methyltransferase
MLREQVQVRVDAGEPVRILDLATGCGRYVLDVLEGFRDQDVSAILRDWEPNNLDQGRASAEALGLDNAVFVQGDAFDAESILGVEPRPNIVIVSGLYELFPGNEGLRASLEGIAGVLEDGGAFIYTCQPWHPQVEMIARTLPNRDGEPWIMRRRTQAEMDELVGSVGLHKRAMRIDEHGIFTVSIAIKA